MDTIARGLAIQAKPHRKNIGIVLLGDSHFNGQQQYVTGTSDANSSIGTLALMSPLDKLWTGTADASVFKADTQINSTSSPNTCQDPNVAISTDRPGPITDALGILRRSYPQLGTIRVANFGVGGSSTYTWAGEQAYGFTFGVANANDGDTFTVAGQVYTFRTSPSVANDVLIGASAAATNQNLAYAINADTGHTSAYGTGTVANASCWVPIAQSTTYERIMARAVGTAGNSIALSSSTTARIAVANGSLGNVASFNLTGGSATSALYANAKSRLPAGFGSVDVILISLGSNDISRYTKLGHNIQATYQTVLNNIKADYPSAAIGIHRPLGSSVSTNVIPAIDALLAANPSVYSMDMYSLGNGTSPCKILAADGLHYTQYGYSLMSSMMASAVASGLSLT